MDVSTLKFFCSECGEKLTMNLFAEDIKDEKRIWLEPCEKCIKSSYNLGYHACDKEHECAF